MHQNVRATLFHLSWENLMSGIQLSRKKVLFFSWTPMLKWQHQYWVNFDLLIHGLTITKPTSWWQRYFQLYLKKNEINKKKKTEYLYRGVLPPRSSAGYTTSDPILTAAHLPRAPLPPVKSSTHQPCSFTKPYDSLHIQLPVPVNGWEGIRVFPPS